MGYDSRDYYRPSGFGRFSLFPPVLKNLLIINVIVFFIQKITALFIYAYTSYGRPVGYDYLIEKYFALMPIVGDFTFYPWQLISYQFMHADFMHILFNMLILYFFGMELENLLGSKKFLIFYLTCGVGAGLLHMFLSPVIGGIPAPTIGASGAVYGVMIAFAMFFPERYVFVYFLIPIKVKYLVAILMVFEFMSVTEASFIAHLAHIGGALTGFLFIMIDRKNEFNINRLFDSFKRPANRNTFRNPTYYKTDEDVQEATFYDIRKEEKIEVTQAEIDAILDKISKSGYQNLSEREKKVLFEASKKK
jgi:membrane associated rhomboid family serine protease